LGTSPRTVTTLLAAISNSSTGFGDLTNSGLTIGSTAILLPEGTDIANYNGPRTGLAIHDYLTAINTMSNWQTENTGANDSNNGTIPDLPFNSTTFNSTASDISFSTEFSIIDENNAGVDVVITLTNPSTGTTAVD